MPELTLARLKSLFEYDPTTGQFSAKVTYRKWAAGALAGSHVYPNGYCYIRIDRELHRVHRLVWFYVYGEWPHEIDHKNGVRHDNRVCNLRDSSRKENGKNVGMKRNNLSGVTGVYWDKQTMSWRATITVDHRTMHLGRYDIFEDAVAARKAAEKAYGFHPNHGKTKEERAKYQG